MRLLPTPAPPRRTPATICFEARAKVRYFPDAKAARHRPGLPGWVCCPLQFRPVAHLAAWLVLTALSAPGERLLDQGLARHQAGPPRTVWSTRALLGAPYLLSALGEEAPPAPEPRFRLDAFDCTTFVETAIALGNARSVAEARILLDDIRYDGPPSYAHRNHYPEAQWLPANARKGWIEEVTEEVAPGESRAIELTLTRASWRAAARSGHLLPHLDPDDLPSGLFRFSVVPLARVSEVAERIPEGTVVAVVRTARANRPYRITHMGLVVKGPAGEVLVRHASTARMRVMEEPLARFVQRAMAASGWKVEGLSLWAIRDNSARVELLRPP
jgi:hypothetical protein